MRYIFDHSPHDARQVEVLDRIRAEFGLFEGEVSELPDELRQLLGVRSTPALIVLPDSMQGNSILQEGADGKLVVTAYLAKLVDEDNAMIYDQEQQRLDKVVDQEVANKTSESFLRLMNTGIILANGEAGKTRELAADAADAAAYVPKRDWEVGMITNPGDFVYDPEKRYLYTYSGTTSMHHDNPLFYPGQIGVYYWAIVPETFNHIKVYPAVDRAVVAVKRNEIWWNIEKTQKYMWVDNDNNACSWYPGQDGVHQWGPISD